MYLDEALPRWDRRERYSISCDTPPAMVMRAAETVTWREALIFHEFTVHPQGLGVTGLHHLMAMRLRFPAWLTYPLIWRPLHDAVLEDTLDRTEKTLTGTVESPTRWSLYVHLLRKILARAVRAGDVPASAPSS